MNQVSSVAADMPQGAMQNLKNWWRDRVYPGLDLHTRSRASLCRYWKSGRRDVLDAGCGNAYFSWLAYQSDANVLALNYDGEQVSKARDFLLGYKQADPRRLQINQFNLYNLGSITRKFDEIICYEVLEHLKGDREILGHFYGLLKPGGVLHLCCPFSLHPHHATSDLDENETGGHVRAGYTQDDYRALLEPIGFEIDTVEGLGSKRLFYADNVIRTVRNRFGNMLALPLLPFLLPFVWLDLPNPEMPFSLYVRAVKRS
jgi:SAM-dependent methyltransferase